MPNFQVPQFIEQKPKIIGPLTLAQFLYIAGAAAVGFAAYYLFNFFLFFLVALIALGAAIALAFVKVNGEEMPKVLLSSFNYFIKPHTYTWQRSFAQKTLEVGDLDNVENLRENMSVGEKIKSIALGIATGKIFSTNDQRLQDQRSKYETVTFLTGETRLAKRVDYGLAQAKKKK